MSELCSSKSHFSSLVISDFILLCSFILSHPLYFSYFIFFSPYLLKLISFLSPLFITTSLLCLALLLHSHSSHTLQTLHFIKDSPNEDENDVVVDLGIYEIVFGPPSMAAVTETETENDDPSQILEQTPQKDHILDPNPLLGSGDEAPIIGKIENLKASESAEAPPPSSVMAEKRLENFLKILDEFERLASNVNEKKKMKKQEPTPTGAKSDKAVEKKQKPLFINGSEAAAAACNNTNQINLDSNVITMTKSHSQRITSSTPADDRDSLSTYGSMRRERVWNRTLAGKLFEERHNAAGAAAGSGGEAMDSLWETYEVDANSSKPGKRRSEKVGRRGKIVEREVEEDDVIGGQLCCLQALKMSAGKMNLGVGKPNLVKISKAIKGIGWLHNLTKNSKKVHNNGDHRF